MKKKFIMMYLIFISVLLCNVVSVFASEGFGEKYLKKLDYTSIAKGTVASYEDLDGKPTILVFGKSTCPNCKSYLNHMDSIINEFNIQNDVNLLFFGLGDTAETMETLINIYPYWDNVNFYYNGNAIIMFDALEDAGYEGYSVSYAVAFYINEEGDLASYSIKSVKDLENIGNIHKAFDIDEFNLGDINNDGKVSIADTSLAYSYYRGKSEIAGKNGLLADYDKNGKISIADVSLIYAKYRNK